VLYRFKRSVDLFLIIKYFVYIGQSADLQLVFISVFSLVLIFLISTNQSLSVI
jgi:hypothetical protein